MRDKLLESGGALDKLAALDPDIADAVKTFGPPADRSLPANFDTLARSIIGQQISRSAAHAIWQRMKDQNIQNKLSLSFRTGDPRRWRLVDPYFLKLPFLPILNGFISYTKW